MTDRTKPLPRLGQKYETRKEPTRPLPCPFCGGLVKPDTRTRPDGKTSTVVGCLVGRCPTMPWAKATSEDEEESLRLAIKKWNTRA